MPCDDCREFRREMYELKEFVAKWFSVLLKRFDCQDRKLISLTEAICGEDICDIMGDINTTANVNLVQSPLHNTNNCGAKIEQEQIINGANPNPYDDDKVSNDDDFKIDNATIPLSEFTNDDFLNYNNEPCDSPIISIESQSSHVSVPSKRRKYSKPNRKPFPLVEFKERSSKLPEKSSTVRLRQTEDEEFEDDNEDMDEDNEEIGEELNLDDDDIDPVVPSTSAGCLESLHEGQRFDSMKDFILALTKYEERRCINLIVADSKKVETANKRVKPGSLSWDTKFKYCYFELRCSRAGIGEQCPFRLLVINSKTERRLVITKMVDSHHQLCAQNGNDEACRMRLLKRLL